MPMTLTELERALWTVEPAALLVPPRLLRRVIKWDRRIPGFGLRAPHRKSYVISRRRLSEIVDEADLGNGRHIPQSEEIMLLVRPSAQQLAEWSAERLLIHCWRLLFHAAVHKKLENRLASSELTAEMLEERIRRLGAVVFEEVRLVLGQEELLLPPQSKAEVYVEFVATYLELRFFTPGLLSYYFPGLKSRSAQVEAILSEDVDGKQLLRTTRPAGAPESPCRTTEKAVVEEESLEQLSSKWTPSAAKFRKLMRKASRAVMIGNIARAARYHAQAEQCAPPDLVKRAQAALQTDILQLCERLQAALNLHVADKQACENILLSLARLSFLGRWATEARLLSDLQKVCLHFEQRTYTVNVTKWLFSFGRRPFRRASPAPYDVPVLKHLQTALARLPALRISQTDREQLASLLQQAGKLLEQRVRERLRPKISAALMAVGLRPQNLPETVAAKKLVEELLDRIVSHGFLTMGNLRDAISRNNLKLPDLSELGDFLRGDELLRADRMLAEALGRVYHRGEFYLRWMQRLSALGFGTRLGRFLTRFAAVPFGGAYVTLAGIHELWQLFAHPRLTPLESETVAEPAKSGFHVVHPWFVLILGVFLLGVVNFAGFRRILKVFLKTISRQVNTLLVKPLRQLLSAPWLQEFIHGRWYTLTVRVVIKPLFWTALLWWALPGKAPDGKMQMDTTVILFFALALLLNSRLGRNVEELVIDWFAQGWRRFGLRAITGLFLLVVDFFKAVVAAVEQMLYVMDEWLRFQSSERGLSLAAKFVLGRIWSFVAYILRFAVNVLIEPQINPIKHFPVVTVSHKLLLPLIPTFAGVLELTLEKALAWTTAATTIWCIPGVFGFLVWELKENWRLYAANRREELGAVAIGPHAETMLRLLRLGFHSGTLPRYYARLRRVARRAEQDDNQPAIQKHLRALQSVETVIRRWVERDFLELLALLPAWQKSPILLEEVRTTTNSLELTFARPQLDGSFLRVAIQWRGWGISGGVVEAGWAEKLPAEQRHTLEAMFAGLYKSAGVELVYQMSEEDIAANGVLALSSANSGNKALAVSSNCTYLTPPSVYNAPNGSQPLSTPNCLLFCEITITWKDWVRYWEEAVAGRSPTVSSLRALRLLPTW